MSLRSQDQHAPKIRHIPYTYSDLNNAFGDHYITQDPALRTASQFDITVFPRGDNRRAVADPMRDTPHVRIRTYPGGGGQEWAVASVTPIGRTPPPAEPFTDTELRLLAAVAGELWAAIQAGQPRDEKLARFQNELLNRAATLHRQQAAENQETGL